MGYLLPIQPIQSQQYANRINMEPDHFATIGRLERIEQTSSFLESFKETLHSQDEEKKREGGESGGELKSMSSPQSYMGYVKPNPSNLSPAISQIVGKGMSVNKYI